MKILIKAPSRSRPLDLIKAIDSVWNNVADVDNTRLNLALDLDDATVNNPEYIKQLDQYPNTTIAWGYSKSKIDAINRDIPMDDWQILVILSDDFRFTFWGFDQIIRYAYQDGNLDKLIHIADQDAGKALATMYIAGRVFYDRFGFVYDNRFLSLFCDNLVQDVAKHLGCYEYVDIPGVILHLNPAYGHGQKDAQFLQQQEVGWTIDQQTYNEIKSGGIENYLVNLQRLS